jgi:hypothetical protein
MPQRYLTVYDYGAGGVWQYFTAISADEIRTKYPALTIVPTIPAWLEEDGSAALQVYDINSEPDAFLTELAKVSGESRSRDK